MSKRSIRQTAAAATVRSSTKWRTCGASVVATRSDAETSPRPSVRPAKPLRHNWQRRGEGPGRLTSFPRSAAFDVAVVVVVTAAAELYKYNVITHFASAHARTLGTNNNAGVVVRVGTTAADFHPIETLDAVIGGGGCTDNAWGKTPSSLRPDAVLYMLAAKAEINIKQCSSDTIYIYTHTRHIGLPLPACASYKYIIFVLYTSVHRIIRLTAIDIQL